MVTMTPNKNYRHVVLLVEDNPEARQLISMLLTEEGCKVIAADNGYKALQIAQETKFDLLVTDLHMPHMTGNELLEKLQLNVPSLCITAVPTQAGSNFDSVLAKPFRIEKLIAEVRVLLKTNKSEEGDHNGI